MLNKGSLDCCSLSLDNHVYCYYNVQVFAAGDNNRDALSRRLLSGVRGRDCVQENTKRCIACFNRIATSLRRLDEAYRSFNQTLFRFDCMPAVDTASATRPFSPNGSCNTCRTWYRRWLLVQTIDVWRAAPCVNWCYYAQLACPHLATSKVVDYAGHPSFQCRDLAIPSSRETDSSWCTCVHPCDLRGMVSSGEVLVSQLSDHDFYASRQHCEARRRQCVRTTAHDRRPRNVAKPCASPAIAVTLTALLAAAVIRM
uniref:Folate_rec domain-containing protein n=1 Tax=Heterorhabditis bacteriophora TaxID=37862 RepID=A0A1I7X4H3_HETBA